jgi:hypothetical protein
MRSPLIHPRSDVCRRDVSSAADWTSVLRLATRWQFTSFRFLALQTLEPIASPLQKFFLARELDIADWLLPAHVALCLRDESLTLGEMRVLPLEDVHLIVTVRERLHTSNVAATVQDVSQHVHALMATSVEAFMPNSAADVMAMLPDEHLTASTLSPSPAPSVTAPIVAVVETAVEADHSPILTAFDSVAMRKALEEAAYDRAIASIFPADSEEASCVLVKWANDCCKAWPSTTYPLRDLVYAFARRCTRDVSFSGTAADILATFRKNAEELQGGNSCASSGGANLQFGACFHYECRTVIKSILGASPVQLDCDPSEHLGMVIYGRTERWLADTDYVSRLDSCIEFVGKALMMGLVSERDITEALRGVTGQTLYQRFLAFGHQLESCPESVDAALKEHDARGNRSYYPYGSPGSEWLEEHRKWLTVSMSCYLVKLAQTTY